MKRSWMISIAIALLAAVLGAGLLAVAAPGPAAAHVLEGPHVLELTAEAMGKIAALQIDQKLLVYAPAPDQEPSVFDETVTYVMPQRFRSDIAADRIQRTHLIFADTALTVIDGRLAVGEDPFDRYQRLLRSRTRSQLMRTLNRMGVETAISSLGRVEETVVFVLGARYPDASVSQLAVDKKTFLPLRLLLVERPSEAGGGRLAITYQDWRKVQSGWFPFQVSFHVNDQLVREIRVADLRINPAIPEGWLDPEALRASLAVSAPETPEEQKQEAVEEVQQAVEAFRKKFE